MKRRILAIILLIIGLTIAIMTPVLAFTPVGASLANGLGANAPTATPTLIPFTPTPPPKPTPVLTVVGKPPVVSAKAAYLLDDDTGNTLDDVNGETPLPMASTTKIMTAYVAMQIADLNMMITVHQDAINEWMNNDGSNAQLHLGDQISLKDLLYALLLPSGDDAAIAIADGVAGSPTNFVRIMNAVAFRLHLYQTHYINPDGLTYYSDQAHTIPLPENQTSAYDLVRLAHAAMQLPLFAQIVRTVKYILPASATHYAYNWLNTNDLLSATALDGIAADVYPGATGIKTGFTLEAGYCLVFSATRNGHHLIGVVLFSTNTLYHQRFRDAKALLDWGFGLPMRVPGT
ncbi:MAG TPA: serine hydrolase [Ktedonobacteraceae bacterium]|nr:serine hydrolase [Ktedonobacteraceae bacterium]